MRDDHGKKDLNMRAQLSHSIGKDCDTPGSRCFSTDYRQH